MVNTDLYLLLGLVVVFGIIAVYTASLVLRFRHEQQMIATLETLENEPDKR
jgi:hypothetical protein